MPPCLGHAVVVYIWKRQGAWLPGAFPASPMSVIPRNPLALAVLMTALLGAGFAAGWVSAPDAVPAPGAPPVEAPAQHGGTAAPGYADLRQSPIRGLTPEQIAAYEQGQGATQALPAELNGYPGPTHVLELREALQLTEDQAAWMEQAKAVMRVEAVARGQELLALHKALDDGFRNGTLDEAALQALLEAIATKDAEVRYAHLRTHLATMDVLTPHQRALYVELRGYGGADHGGHAHG